ncbi:MAG: hypothetical protein ABEJ05_11995 [Haloglomus sp.]
MQEDREAVVAAVCERTPDATPAHVREPPTGRSKHTAFVTLTDGREVVVQYRSRERPLDAESAVVRAVADRTDVPVAPVLASGALADPSVSYLVTERVPGDDLHERFTALDTEEAVPFHRERIGAAPTGCRDNVTTAGCQLPHPTSLTLTGSLLEEGDSALPFS